MTVSPRWSWSTGEKGRNRVRVFEHWKSGRLFVQFSEPVAGGSPRVRCMALGHSDRERAKAQAEELAARFRTAGVDRPQHLTLAALFDNYLTEVTPSKARMTQLHDRACAELFLRAFGANTEARTLSRREWDRFVRDRSSGLLRPKTVAARRPVGPRQVSYDLQWLRATLTWATMASDGRGGVLLDRNPLKGLELPASVSPRRVVLTQLEYDAMRQVAFVVGASFELALVLANETGHRASGIRALRWSDVDLSRARIRWRADVDKIRFEHETPLTAAALEILQLRAARRPACDGWLFPCPTSHDRPVRRETFTSWWKWAEQLAGLEPKRGRGWHSLRRKFATELKTAPLKDLCALGGWKAPATVLTCYIQPDEATMRDALANRKPLRSSP